jgi:NADH-quinone oxidoreductase subunit L
LVTHAFFKALLFLCSGSVIHGTGTQEMPEMGGLHKKMPITSITMLIGVLAISGFPFMSGFYSKDLIIAHTLAYGANNAHHALILSLPILTAGITTFYMFRLWFMTFTGAPRDRHVHDHAHESTPLMWVPLAILSFFAIFAAGLPFWHGLENLITFGQPGAVDADYIHQVHEMHGLATLVASGSALMGFGLAAAIYWFKVLDPNDARRQFANIYRVLVNKWYFDELYRYLIVRPGLVFSNWIAAFDRTVVDGFVNACATWTVRFSRLDGKFDLGVVDGLVNLIGDVVFHGGLSLRKLQTGWLRGYVMMIAVGSIFLFTLGAVLFK